MDHRGDFAERNAERLGELGLVHQLSGAVAQDVNAEQIAFSIADELAQPFVGQIRFGTIDLLVFPAINPDGIAVPGPGLLLGQPGVGQFRIGIGCPENVVVVGKQALVVAMTASYSAICVNK